MFHNDKLFEKVDLVQSCTICDTVPCSCPKETSDSLIGQVVSDHFEIIELIGVGGMGSVYKAKHSIIGKVVAIKILSAVRQDDPKSIMRFQREAQAVAGLDHPNLVSVLNFGFLSTDQPYIVMDYVAGRSLSEVLREDGALPAGRAMRLFCQICAGLAHAHNKGIIHRDLKPSNIMITKDETGKDYVKVVDFGIAKIDQEDEKLKTISETGDVLGSPLYMSPEQCAGKELDWRSDLYSLGCLMYETMAGVPPFTGQNTLQTIYMHINEKAPKLSSITKNVPAQLESVIFKCLEKDPQDRYQSATEIQNILDALCADLLKTPQKYPTNAGTRSDQGQASADSSPQLAQTIKTFRKPLLIGALSMILLALGLYFMNSFHQSNTERVSQLLKHGKELIDQNKRSEAIQPLMDANSICERDFVKDKVHADVEFWLADALESRDDQQKSAIDSYARAAEIYKGNKDNLGFRNACMRAGLNLHNRNEEEKANYFFKQALRNADEDPDRPKSSDPESYIGMLLSLAGTEAALPGHREMAEELYQKTLTMARRQSNVPTICRLKCLKEAAEFFFAGHADKQAKKLLNEWKTVNFIPRNSDDKRDYKYFDEQIVKLQQQLSLPKGI